MSIALLVFFMHMADVYRLDLTLKRDRSNPGQVFQYSRFNGAFRAKFAVPQRVFCGCLMLCGVEVCEVLVCLSTCTVSFGCFGDTLF